MKDTYARLLQLIDKSISLSEMEKIQFLEYIYHNPSRIDYYIKVLENEGSKIFELQAEYCDIYNTLTASLITNLST